MSRNQPCVFRHAAERGLLGRVDSARHHRLEIWGDMGRYGEIWGDRPAWSGRQRAPPPTGERRRCAPSPIPPEYRIQCGFSPVVVGDDVRRRQHRIDGHVRLRAVAALARHLTTPPTRGTSRRSGGFGYRGGRGGWALGVGGGRAGEVARSLPHHPKTEPTPDSRLWRCGTRRHQCCLQVYLPISPHLSPSLPISPHLSPSLTGLLLPPGLSPHISPYLTGLLLPPGLSPHIYP